MKPNRLNQLFRGSEPVEEFFGLGDLIAEAARAVHIQPCDGCRKRQQILNRLAPRLLRRLRRP